MNKSTLVLIILGIFLLGLATRLVHLEHPARHDEAHNYLYNVYAAQPWDYTEPNNHVFHTLLGILIIPLTEPSLEAFRVVSLMAACALILLSAWVAGRIGSQHHLAALLAGLFICGSSRLIDYSINARGYSLLFSIVLVIWGLLMVLSDHPRRIWLWLAIAFLAALGCWTIPIMILPLFGMSVLFLLNNHQDLKRLVLPGIFTTVLFALLTLIAYLPIIHQNGWEALVSNRWVKPESAGIVIQQLPGFILDMFVYFHAYDNPITTVLVITGLIASGLLAFRQKSWWPVSWLVVLLCSVFFLLIQRRLPPERVMLFVLPFIYVCAAVGLSSFLLKLCKRREKSAGSILFGVALTGCLLNLGKIAWSPTVIPQETDGVMYAEEIVRDLAGKGLYTGNMAIMLDIPISPSFWYYLTESFPLHPNARIPPTEPSAETHRVAIITSGEMPHEELVGRLQREAIIIGSPVYHKIHPGAKVSIYKQVRQGAQDP